MNDEELFSIHKKICDNALLLMREKNHDYSGKSGKEPFANFTCSEAMGITTTEKGMLVRLLDKFSRLSTFCDTGEFKVQDEKLEDTIIDIVNYSILLYAYVQSKKDDKQLMIDYEKSIKDEVCCDPILLKMDITRDKGRNLTNYF